MNFEAVHNVFDPEEASEQRHTLLHAFDAVVLERRVLEPKVVCVSRCIEPLPERTDI